VESDEAHYYILKRLVPRDRPEQQDEWAYSHGKSPDDALAYFERAHGLRALEIGSPGCDDADFILEHRVRDPRGEGGHVGVRPGQVLATFLVRRT